MVMGDTCTRGCRFCAVKTLKRPAPLDPEEPRHVAVAIAEMQLDYVVLTSVDRDELPDQGAGHFAACVRAIREAAPQTMIEVLIPDFRGEVPLVSKVVEARPEVIAHNVETIERLTPRVRDARATYRQSLAVLTAIKQLDPTRFTKSSLMVGLGETEDEIVAAMRDLRAVDCDFLTIGQYLQPTTWHLDVVEFVHPDVFARYERIGLELGFKYVASGPLVRSSYKAGEFFIEKFVRAQQTA
jgi:lipoic acid synthetase